MRFACRPVDASFFSTAPLRFVHSCEVAASPAALFAQLEDPASWPQWFKGIRQVVWTSPKPFGVGTTRTVVLDSGTVDEYFFVWESGRRFSFFVSGQSVPLFRALAEDYLIEPLGEQRLRFTYTVAIDPGLLLRLGGKLASQQLDRMFGQVMVTLPPFMASRAGG
jgi:hypothetical protein